MPEPDPQDEFDTKLSHIKDCIKDAYTSIEDFAISYGAQEEGKWPTVDALMDAVDELDFAFRKLEHELLYGPDDGQEPPSL